MKIKYNSTTKLKEENSHNIIDDTQKEDELSDRFLYGYLIICGVIITVLKIFG